jgi:RND family efflux transporter MFP subunit
MTRKRPILITITFFLLAGIIFMIIFRPKPNPIDRWEFAQAAVQNLVQTVGVSGTIIPVSEVDLAFESTGRLGYLAGANGTRVNKGTLLASMTSAELTADLAKANASVAGASALLVQYESQIETQKIKLTELEKGTRLEEIRVKEAELSSAQIELQRLESTTTNVLMDAEILAIDAVNRLTDAFFENDQTVVPRFAFQTSSSVSADTLQTHRKSVRDILAQFEKTDLSTASSQLMKIKLYFTLLSTAFDQVIAFSDGSPISTAAIESHKTSLKTALTNVQSAINSIEDRLNAITTQNATMYRMTQELVLKQAHATDEQIRAQQAAIAQAQAQVLSQKANVAQAEAMVQSVYAQFAKRAIYAPFSGMIAKRHAEVGETVSAGAPIVSLISNAAYQIETHIPEVDIRLVEIGQRAQIELDAYPSETFTATVVQIDPAETVIDGVSTYRVLLEFTQKDERLRSGMTVNSDIVTNERMNALTVPQRSLVERDVKTFVRVRIGQIIEDREVRVGVRANGLAEILSGIQANEQIVVRETR